MNAKTNFEIVFERLRKILKPYADDLDLIVDEPENYYLNTKYIMKNKKQMYFGSVKISKSYVSFHLMPVYVFPELLDEISEDLKKRMQGKSCFNFKLVDESFFTELEVITKRGFQKYENSDYI